ncbi:hypothetical protein M409DRAFT_63427 [Zasmidium cellare ATCC 36951]|uniref:Carboxylic ester hydrolase n=1 Tax=Zasmidium cellare ATCC 36951 TaxID=1080233 RepID=A0A6A6CYQ6_ZASCE|nr:uncharacterized protein M409DRAFT_63427 [Zasmidium cellare ATCC 36951]KAF2171883.1 hypothetical protein M409DRAFT_63427 [Zasmidium cellare ATCC 36951]
MLFSLLFAASLVAGNPPAYNAAPYSYGIRSRQDNGARGNDTSPIEVDLWYSIYRGIFNSTTNHNVFLGIRYAQAPVGKLRWQAPRAPLVNRSDTIEALEPPSQCPQGYAGSYNILSTDQTGSSEDCLFLNVWSPNTVLDRLPVLVWIHGGGYGEGSAATVSLDTIVSTNNNTFVAVAIQYRLGAFGFLSSDEVFRNGVVNAGILDQTMALQWVQQYIHVFGGDPDKVTIMGESAGAGSVMLQTMAYGGTLGTILFRNSIAASPYLPMQYGYKDWQPSQTYYAFAAEAGCAAKRPYGANGSVPIFECLQNATSERLINASATISQSGAYGSWSFLPVTDGVFIQDLPSRQLGRGNVNGVNALLGNNANEGAGFVPQNILTEDNLVAWLRSAFPLFSNIDIAKVLYYYPSSNASTNPDAALWATSGNNGTTALNQSSAATGQQQRAANIYAETTFVCPSYWLAEAFSENEMCGQAYKYQFSVAPALHGDDLRAIFLPLDDPPYTSDFRVAFQRMIGNFITHSNPSISQQEDIGVSISQNLSTSTAGPAVEWPPFSIHAPYQVDFNTTCGSDRIPDGDESSGLYYCSGPGTNNDFRLVNAYSWEGGRGIRCDFWRSTGELVPE